MPENFRIMFTDRLMKAVVKYLDWLFLFLFLSGCEHLEQKADTVGGFFRPAPVLPVLEVIQTSVPAGFSAAVAMSDQLGHVIPDADVFRYNGLSVIHLENNHEYPLSLLPVPCDDIYLLRLGMEEDMCMIGSYFVSNDRLTGQQKVYHMGPIPVMLDAQIVRAIFVRNHVSVEDELNLELNISQGEIAMAVEKLKIPKPEDVSVAIEQDAWIIEIHPGDTWTDFSDDKFMLTGGEQEVTLHSHPEDNAASVLQMAMIGLLIDPSCLKNPVAGFSVLREISVETGNDKKLEDLVLGTIFYTFTESCTGRIKVPIATGSFILSLGQEVKFNMLDNN
jgi:hypothetical protein